jgi:hypothetical protein
LFSHPIGIAQRDGVHFFRLRGLTLRPPSLLQRNSCPVSAIRRVVDPPA